MLICGQKESTDGNTKDTHRIKILCDLKNKFFEPEFFQIKDN